jgi:hypothetical protein
MKNKYVPVEGFSGLVRDMDTNVIHNVDKDSIERARDRKRQKQLQKEQQKQLIDRVESIETDMHDIKSMLKELLQKNI